MSKSQGNMSLGEPPRFPNPWLLGAGILAVEMPLVLVITFQPLLVGAILDQGRLGPTQAGALLTLQALGAAALPPVLARHLAKLRIDRLGLLGLLVWALCNALAAVTVRVEFLFFALAVAGLGLGAMASAAGVALATAAQPGRMTALVVMVASALGNLSAIPLATMMQSGGASMGFAALAGAGGLLLGLTLLLPRHGPVAAQPVAPGRRLLCQPLVLATVAVGVGATAVWPFSERIGVGLGMSVEELGRVIAITGIVGLSGGGLATFAAGKACVKPWMLAGVLFFGAAGAWVALAGDRTAFSTGLAALAIGYLFVFPLLTALALKLDSSGGMAGTVTGVLMLANSLSPFIGGLLVEDGAYEFLAWHSLTATLVAAVLILAVREPADRIAVRA